MAESRARAESEVCSRMDSATRFESRSPKMQFKKSLLPKLLQVNSNRNNRTRIKKNLRFQKNSLRISRLPFTNSIVVKSIGSNSVRKRQLPPISRRGFLQRSKRKNGRDRSLQPGSKSPECR